MCSEVFGFDINYFVYETSSPKAKATHDEDYLFLESSSWEEIASLVVSSSELRDAVMEVKTGESHFMHTNYHAQNHQLFHFDRVWDSKNHFLQVVAPFSSEKSLMEEGNFKVGKYNKEERKWRIDRYRAKRTRRNFNKTIKYACRKTLADGRQRIRGRFARNDEVGEILEASLFQRCEDKYDL
ncbi:uncharacterized protein LOC131024975 [Salvia miltiorrhiza]|uniref:uncharacterized protein LOC131024975 n=1 Tax=Salvia miltiorrhiza TaxID=226208 RepID=UPI0025AD72EF|nr:uncharacterized protein LOC131024975 [Salvia miltiorrhiza]